MRTGVNAFNGKVLTGWDHCAQSLSKILSTDKRSRVLRRHLGSDVRSLQDDNATNATFLKLAVALSEAIEHPVDGEPGFLLQELNLIKGSRQGRFAFEMVGTYFPEGHLGNFNFSEDKRLGLQNDVRANFTEVEV